MKIKKNRGNALIPAIFLLLFVSIFGAVLLKLALQSANFSTHIANVRQVRLLAKSAADYICDTMAGSQTKPLFTSLDTLLSGIAVNTSIDAPVVIDGNEVKTNIKLLSRTVNGNKTNEVFTVTSVAKIGNVSHSMSREMQAERTKGGLGDISTTGVYNGKQKARYFIFGSGRPVPEGKINGSVRFENIEDLTIMQLNVNGDLFLRGDFTSTGGIDLMDTKVSKNLYIENTSSTYASSIILYKVDVGQDIVIHTNGQVAFNSAINASNIYIYAKGGLSYSHFQNSTIDNLYLAPPLISNSFIESKVSGTVHTGSAAAAAVNGKYRPASVDPPIELNIPVPSVFDYTIETDEDWADVDLDFSAKSVYNILVKQEIWKNELNVEGSGAVNLYSDNSPNTTILLNDFNVKHAEGSTAAVNIISTAEGVTALYNGGYNILPEQVNLIIPKGTIDLTNTAIQGVAIAGTYVINGPGTPYLQLPYFDYEAPWADFGGGLPIAGKDSVKYTYGPYLN